MPHSILAVDDTEATRFFEQKLLEEAGYQVHHVSDGELGLAMAARMQPDLVLLDVNSPHLDGVECCRQLKQSHKTQRIKVIMLTAEHNLRQVRQAFSAGCDACLTKPIDGQELLGKVSQLLRLSSARQELRHLVR